MNPSTRTTLEQWRALQSVIDCGGFAQAAEYLHRSQSAISYSVAKLQRQLGVELLVVHGRKAQLTETGSTLLARARHMINDASELEQMASRLEAGWEGEIELVIDAAFPNNLIMQTLTIFAETSPQTRIQLREVVLSGAEDALNAGQADIVISSIIPPGFNGEKLLEVEFVAVAHPDHPLHHKKELSFSDLKNETQLVIRDSGIHRQRDAGWLGAKHRWTVSHLGTSVQAITRKLGFGWLPAHAIQYELNNNLLKPLPLPHGQRRHALFYLIFGHDSHIGPGTKQLADMLRKTVKQQAE